MIPLPLCGRALEILKTALAHVIRNRVEVAYARSDLFERPRILDGRLGALSGPRDGGEPGALTVRKPGGSALEQSIDISLLLGGETQRSAEPSFFPLWNPMRILMTFLQAGRVLAAHPRNRWSILT